MAVVARAEYSSGHYRMALAAAKTAAKASGRSRRVFQRQADGAEEQALMQIERIPPGPSRPTPLLLTA